MIKNKEKEKAGKESVAQERMIYTIRKRGERAINTTVVAACRFKCLKKEVFRG